MIKIMGKWSNANPKIKKNLPNFKIKKSLQYNIFVSWIKYNLVFFRSDASMSLSHISRFDFKYGYSCHWQSMVLSMKPDFFQNVPEFGFKINGFINTDRIEENHKNLFYILAIHVSWRNA